MKGPLSRPGRPPRADSAVSPICDDSVTSSQHRPGRPPRAGERATKRAEIRLTLSELRAVQALARANDCSISDLIRLTLLMSADDSGAAAPVVLGKELIARIVAGRIGSAAGRLSEEV